MTQPINLNKFRKARAKSEKDERAAENRARHGRTKADRDADKARAEKAAREIDAHKRGD